MSQKLTRTINLPKAPASFTDEQKRYMDDFARSLIGQFRDMFDLLGEDAGSLEKHMGDVTAHKMSEGNTASVGVIRTAEGKIRFASADGTEETDDYGVSAGYVSPAVEHVTDQSAGVHGSTSTPSAGKIAAYASNGRLKGDAPTEDNDLVNRKYFSDHTERSASPSHGVLAEFDSYGRLQTEYPLSGKDAASYEFVINAIDGVLDRLVFRAAGYPAASAGSGLLLYSIEDGTGQYNEANGLIELPAGLYLCIMRTFGNNSLKLGNTNNTYVYGSGPTIAGVFRLSSADTMQVLTDGALDAQARGSRYGVEIISL